MGLLKRNIVGQMSGVHGHRDGELAVSWEADPSGKGVKWGGCGWLVEESGCAQARVCVCITGETQQES